MTTSAVAKCPVCNGNGQVSAGFYSHPGDHPYWSSTGTNSELCRSCQGKGYIIYPNPEVIEQKETDAFNNTALSATLC